LRSLFLSLTALAAAALLWAADQPIAYSHKKHVAMGLQCKGCHTMPGDGEAATFPKESLCMGCHAGVKKDSPEILKLAEFARKKEPVPWVRLYKLPDFVWFSHKVHVERTSCERCHGPVAEREVLKK
jgi:hypothetical protein